MLQPRDVLLDRPQGALGWRNLLQPRCPEQRQHPGDDQIEQRGQEVRPEPLHAGPGEQLSEPDRDRDQSAEAEARGSHQEPDAKRGRHGLLRELRFREIDLLPDE